MFFFLSAFLQVSSLSAAALLRLLASVSSPVFAFPAVHLHGFESLFAPSISRRTWSARLFLAGYKSTTDATPHIVMPGSSLKAHVPKVCAKWRRTVRFSVSTKFRKGTEVCYSAALCQPSCAQSPRFAPRSTTCSRRFCTDVPCRVQSFQCKRDFQCGNVFLKPVILDIQYVYSMETQS